MLGNTTEGRAESWRYHRHGVAELEKIAPSDACFQRIILLALMRPPLGFDPRAARRALAEIEPLGERSSIRGRVLCSAAQSWTERGDLREAGELLREALAIDDLIDHNRSVTLDYQADVELTAGRIARAEEHYRAASSLRERAGTGTFDPAFSLSTCAQLQGELDVARHILVGVAAQPEKVSANLGQFSARRELAEIAMAEGDVPRALADFRALLHEAASSRDDGRLYDTSVTYISSLRAAHEASLLTPTDLTDADAEIDVAEDVALSIARNDPPWYTILFPGLRAELLSLHPDRLPEAIALATGALERARTLWPDAAPMHARMLVAHLVRAGRLDEARAALALAIPEADAQRHLRELARLRAFEVAVLVRTASPVPAIDAAVRALRATLDETDAPRIAADTLVELAELLPPASPHPDPLALLDEAGELFAEMPIPEREARTLEATGDVLAARGDATTQRRYLEAKALCERYGLGLRVPLLTRKSPP